MNPYQQASKLKPIVNPYAQYEAEKAAQACLAYNILAAKALKGYGLL